MSGSAARCSGNAPLWGNLTAGPLNYTLVVSRTTVLVTAGGVHRRDMWWHDHGADDGAVPQDGGAAMGALRKAGVWLGLVEDEDDRSYGDRGYEERGYRYGDDFGDDDEVDEPVLPSRSRAAERPADRSVERESARESVRERSSTVRSITRPSPSQMSYPTRDNLALAPQVQVRERSVANVEEERRYQITTLHPTTYNEARTIGEHFRDNVPVIMNLTEMDESDAKRLVDFAAGLAFGLRGTIERVTNRVFLLSPANVQVTAEDKAKIAEGGFFNQS
jgi:cell division inhibitor SepF